MIQEIDKGMNNDKNEVDFDLEKFNDLLEKTMVLLNQTRMAIRYQRRRSFLSAIMRSDYKAKQLIKTHAKALRVSKTKGKLFGKKFRKLLKKEESIDDIAKVLMPAKQPFAAAQPTHNQRGGVGGAKKLVATKQQITTPSPQNNSNFGNRGRSSSNRRGKSSSFIRRSSCFTLASPNHHQKSGGGGHKVQSGKMEKVDLRPGYPRTSKRVHNSFPRATFTRKRTSRISSKRGRKGNSVEGDSLDGTKRGHTKGRPCRRRVSFTNFSNRKERTRQIQNNNKFEEIKQLHTLRKIQDGVSSRPKRHFKTKRLVGKVGSYGCLPQCGNKSGNIGKICKISVERAIIPVPNANVRARTCTKAIHKTTKSTHIITPKVVGTNNNLHRRHDHRRGKFRRNRTSKGHNDLPSKSSRLSDKLCKVSTSSNTQVGILGGHGKLSRHVLFNTRNKDEKLEAKMLSNVECQSLNCEVINPTDGEIESNRNSVLSSPTAVEELTKLDKNSSKKKRLIRKSRQTGQRVQTRNTMVDSKSQTAQWETSVYKSSGNSNLDRCFTRGMGSSLSGAKDGGQMDPRRARSPHKCSGTSSGEEGNRNFHQNSQSELDTHASRQYFGFSLPPENGGESKSNDEFNHKRNLGIPVEEQNHLHRRISPIGTECGSRRNVSLDRFKRVASRPSVVRKHKSHHGVTRHRPLCITSNSSTGEVHKLETRPKVSSGRCFPTELDSNESVRVSAFQTDRKNSKKGADAPHLVNDHNYTVMAHTTMVCNPAGHDHSEANIASKGTKCADRPSRQTTSTIGTKPTPISGLANLRAKLQTEGVSKRTAEIITSTRATGTYDMYESAWKVFSGWCEQRETDPFGCPLNTILDYLTEMLDVKHRAYRTINNHRSAISAFHEEIDGFKVGQHPRVTELLKGISYSNPPEPRLSKVWDVDILINQFKMTPVNKELSLKDLTLKTVALLALTALPRVSELAMLDIEWLIRKENVYTFQLVGRAKHSKLGKITPPIKFTRFEGNPNICPIASIDEYMHKTKPLRETSGVSKFFICLVKPHGAASAATIRRWMLEAMSLAGIDTDVYKAHSTRASSSSKARNSLNVPLNVILEMGNWKSSSVWERHYHKPICTAARKFQNSILKQ